MYSFSRNYRLCEEIGRGTHAVVHRCYSLVSGNSFACKSIDKRSFFSTHKALHLYKESEICKFLSKNVPGVIRMHDVHDDDNYLRIIFDFCSSGNLSDRIYQNPLSESQAKVYFRDLMWAVARCHRVGIAHRDIKPSNVLFDSKNKLKLIDFGSAEWFVVNERKVAMSQVVGTLDFMAPEVLSGEKYNEKVDVWSCGVVLYMMLTGSAPFRRDSDAETVETVLKGSLIFPENISSKAEDLLRKMLCRGSVTRLSAEEVLRHPWVVERDESAMHMEDYYKHDVRSRFFGTSREAHSL